MQPLSRVARRRAGPDAGDRRLCRAVADRWAGTLSDVLRLAVPPRHARVEKRACRCLAAGSRSAGPGRLDPLRRRGGVPGTPRRRRRAPRDVGGAARPATGRRELAAAAQATLSGGRGVVVVVPDGTRRRPRSCRAAGSDRRRAASSSSPPISARPSATGASCGWPAARSRSSSAPGRPRTPRSPISGWSRSGTTAPTCMTSRTRPTPTCATSLVLRAHLAGAGALLGGHAAERRGRLAGRLRLVAPVGSTARGDPGGGAAGGGRRLRRAARPRPGGARAARLPGARLRCRPARRSTPVAPRWSACRAAATGRRSPATRCRTAGRCPRLRRAAGPGELVRARSTCRWCGDRARRPGVPASAAPERWRAVVVGDVRTAEELGRAFPGVPVIRSSGAGVVAAVAGRARAGRRDSRRRAGRRRRLRRGAAARRLGAARPGRPAGGRGGAAPLDGRCGAGASRRPTAGAWCSWEPPPSCARCRRWCAGTRSATRDARPPSRASSASRRSSRMAALDGAPAEHRRVPGQRRAAGRTPSCSGRCRCRRGERRAACWSGCRAPRARALARAADRAAAAQRHEGRRSFASGSTRPRSADVAGWIASTVRRLSLAPPDRRLQGASRCGRPAHPPVR